VIIAVVLASVHCNPECHCELKGSSKFISEPYGFFDLGDFEVFFEAEDVGDDDDVGDGMEGNSKVPNSPEPLN